VGLAAAEQFAKRGDQVVLIGRTPARLDEAAARVPTADRYRADFEDLGQVRELAEKLRTAYPRIDVLANNAGGMLSGYRRTPDGFEATIQGNHLAHFLLTNLLREQLRGGRIVHTASRAHVQGRPDPDDFTGDPARYKAWPAYGAAKTANILFAAEAARRWPDVTSVSFHPGVVRSNFGGDGKALRLFYRYAPFLVTPEKAGELLVWLATTPAEQLTDGAFYVGRQVKAPAPHASDPAAATKLWDTSARAVGL